MFASYSKYSEMYFTDGCKVWCPFSRSDIKGMVTWRISSKRVFVFHEIFSIDNLINYSREMFTKSPCGLNPLPTGKHLPHISVWSSSLSDASLYCPSITSSVAESSIQIEREYYLRKGIRQTHVCDHVSFSGMSRCDASTQTSTLDSTECVQICATRSEVRKCSDLCYKTSLL